MCNNSALTHGQARADAGELRQLAGDAVHLDAQLSGGHQNQHTRHLRLSRLVDQTLQNRQHEGRSLSWDTHRNQSHSSSLINRNSPSYSFFLVQSNTDGSLTRASGGTRTDVFSQQPHRHAGFLNGSGLLKAHSRDGLNKHKENTSGTRRILVWRHALHHTVRV